MTSEATHEKGRKGVFNAKGFLERLLGSGISLHYNAYDHQQTLDFHDNEHDLGEFNFDLRGNLSRPDTDKFSNTEVIEVLVEVKNYDIGSSLLSKFESFLQKTACVTKFSEHKDTWFIFFTSVPFGSTKGKELCDGSLLEDCSTDWPTTLKYNPAQMYQRVSLVIPKDSLRRLLKWSYKESES